MTTQYTVCFVTAGSEETAASLAKGLVEGKLAACVSVIGKVSSTYRWQGKIETARECLMIIKTRKTLASDIQQYIKKNHPNKVPEVIFLNVANGSKAYLDWMGANTLFTSNIAKDKTEKDI